MNQREYARPPIRVRNWLLLVVGVCMLSSLGGCSIWRETGRVFALAKRTTQVEPHYFEYIQSDRVAQREARLLAEQAWAESPNLGSASPDFENGYHEGFADYLYRGGSGEPPIIPPRGYWHLRFLNQFGKTSTNDWYEGFRTGAADCKARGLRDMWLIPTSLIADPDPPSATADWTDEETWDKETYERRVEQRNRENQGDLESLRDPEDPPTPDIGEDQYAPSEMTPSADNKSDEGDTGDLRDTPRDNIPNLPNPFENDDRSDGTGADDTGTDDIGFGLGDPEDGGDQPGNANNDGPFGLQPDPSEESGDSELIMRDEASGRDTPSFDEAFGEDPLPGSDSLDDALDNALDGELLPGGDSVPGEGSGGDGDFGADDLSGMIRFKKSRSVRNDRRTSNQRVRRDTAVRQTGGTSRPSQVKPGNKLRARRSNQADRSRVSQPQVSTQPRPYAIQTRSNGINTRDSVTRVATQPNTRQVAKRSTNPPSNPKRQAPAAPAIEITAADLMFDDSDTPPAMSQPTTAPKTPKREFGLEKVPTLPLQVENSRASDFMQWDPMEGIESKPAFEDLDAKFKTVMSDEAIEQSTQWTAEMSRATELPLRVADMRMQNVERPTFGKAAPNVNSANPAGKTPSGKDRSGGLMDQLRRALNSSAKTSKQARQSTNNQAIIRDYNRENIRQNVIRAEPQELPPIVDLPDVIDRGARPQTSTSGNAIQFRIRD